MKPPLRTMGGTIDVRPIDALDGLNLVYESMSGIVVLTLTRTQATALRDALTGWLDE